jgi:hypothetical protein
MKLTRETADAIDALRREGRVTERAAGAVADAPPMTEEQFLQRVLLLARGLGWRTAHFRASRTKDGWRTAVGGDGKGFVDVVFVRDRVVWAELKSEGGRVRPEQKEWADALEAAGQEVYLWRPENMGQIEVVLGA